MALAEYDRLHDHRGHYLPETTGEANAGWFTADDSTICWACAAIEQYERDHRQDEPDPGRLIAVRRLTPDEA